MPNDTRSYLDFVLSKKAQLLSDRTIEFYDRTAQPFAKAYEPTPQGWRSYLADLQARGLSDSTIHLHAAGAKTYLRFLFREWDVKPFEILMPKPAQRRMRIPTVDEFQRLLQAARSDRDRALLLVLADTGLRLSECASLTWEDIDLPTGAVRVVQGKGRRDRTVVLGLATRRALVRLGPCQGQVWRLTRDGVKQVIRRLSQKTGIAVSPHDLRRFFATGSLRAGMSPIHVQRLLGHTTLAMTQRYAILVDDDLISAHAAHGPIDALMGKARAKLR